MSKQRQQPVTDATARTQITIGSTRSCVCDHIFVWFSLPLIFEMFLFFNQYKIKHTFMIPFPLNPRLRLKLLNGIIDKRQYDLVDLFEHTKRQFE